VIPSLEITARLGAARTGIATTARGRFGIPCFMPVGTRGVVRALDAVDLAALGAEVVLGNTYHLMLRPGADVVGALGGLHRFSGWDGHMLTDSGGFQVHSLQSRVDDRGVTFRSVYDGSTVRLTPESAVAVQEELGADVQMVLDVCTGLPATRAELALAADRTAAWARRARDAHRRSADQSLFGIVQGGVDEELRVKSARATVAVDFDGYALGGLSVGEPRPEMLRVLDVTVPLLPAGRLRYLMGVGDPVGIVESVARGVDLFDCVAPTRAARHGTAWTWGGKVSLRAAANAALDAPIEKGCRCPTCGRWSRGYLRHLLAVGEPTAMRLVSLHNLAFMFDLVNRIRAAVTDGTLPALREELAGAWGANARLD
jgi:queuine tRNA-ribosyltransferase